ncbi:MAG: hypothetical protein KBA51_05645 [Kiritimatiellae bacterium]|nr:hypothetical protein [Kiritimatiellia bacterium]
MKTQQEESHNRLHTPPEIFLHEKIVALVKALARAAAESDHRAERERENGPLQ